MIRFPWSSKKYALKRVIGVMLSAGFYVTSSQPAFGQGDGDDISQWFSFFGHFHALIVHLPIGFLLLAGMMEAFMFIKKQKVFEPAISFALYLSAGSSLVAALFGYMLSLDGGYGDDLLNTHMWLGILLTICSFILIFLKAKKMNAKIYYPVLTLSLVLLSATGHYGGSLTHGENYLTKDMPTGLKGLLGIAPQNKGILANVQSIDEAIVFANIIQPVLEDKCVSCHNTSKSKGGLKMHSLEALLAGGESGPAFVPADTGQSLMIKHVSLPLDQEEHMPPKGKPQLDTDEIALMKWWVASGADTKSTVATLEKSPDIEGILKKLEEKMTKKINPVFAKEIDFADEDDLMEMMENQVTITPLSSESPFVHVRIDSEASNLDDLLEPIAEQMVSLDLSKTQSSDASLKEIRDFGNLIKLYLQNTNITDNGLKHLKKLTHLEYLNLYGTQVTDQGIAHLTELKLLKHLYLWKTQVSDEATLALAKKRPELVIEKGIDIAQLDTVRLAKPFIETERPIFKDTTQVKLSLGIENVKIYYTLDGSEPDGSSKLYVSPITITSSCTIKAIVSKEGWRPSKASVVDLTKVKFLIQTAQLQNQPSEQYRANGPLSLIDSRRGSDDFRDDQWLGFHEVDLVAQLDMGKTIDMKKVTLGCFEDISSYIFFSTSITISYSNDGTTYTKLVTKKITPARESRQASLKNYQLDFANTKVRYLKLEASNMGLCPSWHPGAGDKAWLFVDEIIVE
ncbi:MAG: chitobiase/beta-hexosaminidase C-terminal domain-containing protein [Reichenbachiella sp.]|uniref:chitobiase/beta-hexosaminidase C-terminal domain-containing protein n=2 Tax=Reichenbachiella sp. TaxID=2184521 RepID=UPI00329A38E6